ncbi:hypothetical protein J2Z83_003562 [Virgibacillus natechei]|uniref:Transposase n=1 Tax=Virgibacillus natechei TaxID=1216297 RepID=A0ABS4IKN2_9BACI|nr:hypothetical protein [Virgibacillus natechei]MBP1971423.1 hypothetical protein [Virgibacillus natechei]
MKKQAVAIDLSDKQHKILEQMARGTHSPLHYIQRSQVILKAADWFGLIGSMIMQMIYGKLQKIS